MTIEWYHVILAWVILEGIRFVYRIISKKFDIAIDYRMEMVRKRTQIYELYYQKAAEFFSAASSGNYKLASEIIGSMGKYSFYISHNIEYKWINLGGKAVRMQGVNLNEKTGSQSWLKLLEELANNVQAFVYELRNELYKGKFERKWLRKQSVEEMIKSLPEYKTAINEAIANLNDPEIKSIKDLMK
ncbi:MAG: hypothetical protein JSU85_04935 [Candidatus Zixiibacteriota bacterium]|nr:MAG: hypothetical protein JSU85_04935 [candidate division Zixibacteria bacterium]